ncbi:MAG: homocysteine S-methyltransferase [Microbacteriaceae bacterium]
MTDSDTVLVIDGGLSTALEDRGHRVTGALWTGELLLSNPEALVDAHRDFVDAGADVIITGSYQLSFDGGRAVGWSDDETERALINSTTAARLAADEGTLVAASVGPYGAFLADGSEFRGGYGVPASTLRDFHARRLDVLLTTEPDLLAIETQPEIDEIRVILELVRERDVDIPFWVTCTVTTPGQISGGASWDEVVSLVAGVDSAIGVGINCSHVDVLTDTLTSATSPIPYVVYPNHGMEWDATTDSWIGTAHTISDRHLDEWKDAGARLIGGCCGFGASSISALRQRV